MHLGLAGLPSFRMYLVRRDTIGFAVSEQPATGAHSRHKRGASLHPRGNANDVDTCRCDVTVCRQQLERGVNIRVEAHRRGVIPAVLASTVSACVYIEPALARSHVWPSRVPALHACSRRGVNILASCFYPHRGRLPAAESLRVWSRYPLAGVTPVS